MSEEKEDEQQTMHALWYCKLKQLHLHASIWAVDSYGQVYNHVLKSVSNAYCYSTCMEIVLMQTWLDETKCISPINLYLTSDEIEVN